MKNRFKEAVEATPDIAQCYRNGLQALKENNLIKVQNQRNLQGSVDIDTCTTQKYPQENRWDYVIGYKNHAFYVEVHGAKDDEVKTLIRKLQWLKGWKAKSDGLSAISSSYHWVFTNRNCITPSSKWTRQIAQAGLRYPVRILDLDRILQG